MASDPDRLHQAGLAALQAGRAAEAEGHFRAAIEARPDHVEAIIMLAVCRGQSGDLGGALAGFDRALALAPGSIVAGLNRATALLSLGRLEEALAGLDRVLESTPGHADALFARAFTLGRLGRQADAIAGYERLLALVPAHAAGWGNRGVLLVAAGRPADGLASIDRALALAPNPDLMVERGNALLALDRTDEAIVLFRHILARLPGHGRTVRTLAAALSTLERHDEALPLWQEALAADPDDIELIGNRANTLHALGLEEAALADYDRFLAHHPNHANALLNRGKMHFKLMRHDAALADLDRALALDPANAAARLSRAFCLMRKGELARAWPDWESRWAGSGADLKPRHFDQQQWLGQRPIAGRRILVHAEQGIGDTIQFCRYAPLVEALGAEIVLEVQRPLTALLATLSGYTGQIRAAGDEVPEIDLHCPLMSLPLAFGTDLASIPSAVPYLGAPAERRAAWQARLGPRDGRRRVGIAWAGNPQFQSDRLRSIALEVLRPLFGLDFDFVSLQRDVPPADLPVLASLPHVRRFEAALRDFADTAALIDQLDLVIAVDTATAHLAGAMAKPVWILLPHSCDWRWLTERDDSPWYPTARLFRERHRADWPAVIERVCAALRGAP